MRDDSNAAGRKRLKNWTDREMRALFQFFEINENVIHSCAQRPRNARFDPRLLSFIGTTQPVSFLCFFQRSSSNMADYDSGDEEGKPTFRQRKGKFTTATIPLPKGPKTKKEWCAHRALSCFLLFLFLFFLFFISSSFIVIS